MEVTTEIQDLNKRVSEIEKALIQISAFSNPNSPLIKLSTYWLPMIVGTIFTLLIVFMAWRTIPIWHTLTQIEKMSVIVMNSPIAVFAIFNWVQLMFSPIRTLKKLEELRA